MRYVVQFSPDALHIEMEGPFTFADARLFHKMMGALSSMGERSEIKLNISRMSYIDATGLRLLMMAYDIAKRNRCDLIFEGPQGQVREALNEAALYNRLIIAA